MNALAPSGEADIVRILHPSSSWGAVTGVSVDMIYDTALVIGNSSLALATKYARKKASNGDLENESPAVCWQRRL